MPATGANCNGSLVSSPRPPGRRSAEAGRSACTPGGDHSGRATLDAFEAILQDQPGTPPGTWSWSMPVWPAPVSRPGPSRWASRSRSSTPAIRARPGPGGVLGAGAGHGHLLAARMARRRGSSVRRIGLPQRQVRSHGLHLGMTTARTSRVLGPGHAITRHEAARLHTADAARFVGDGEIRGTLTPGKLASSPIPTTRSPARSTSCPASSPSSPWSAGTLATTLAGSSRTVSYGRGLPATAEPRTGTREAAVAGSHLPGAWRTSWRRCAGGGQVPAGRGGGDSETRPHLGHVVLVGADLRQAGPGSWPARSAARSHLLGCRARWRAPETLVGQQKDMTRAGPWQRQDHVQGTATSVQTTSESDIGRPIAHPARHDRVGPAALASIKTGILKVSLHRCLPPRS